MKPRNITMIRKLAMAALIVVIVGLGVVSMSTLSGLAVPGTVLAASPERQKDEENSATVSAQDKDGAPKGKESLSDLATSLPVTDSFRLTADAWCKDVKAREKVVARQTEELVQLRQDVMAKLARLEKLRAELEQITGQLEKSRKKDLAKAVQVYSAMEPAQAAKIFDQMDLESVVAILKDMDVETAGGILDAMTTSGTDSARMAKLKAIGESLVDSRKAKKQP